jgi:hypothetical protein
LSISDERGSWFEELRQKTCFAASASNVNH